MKNSWHRMQLLTPLTTLTVKITMFVPYHTNTACSAQDAIELGLRVSKLPWSPYLTDGCMAKLWF